MDKRTFKKALTRATHGCAIQYHGWTCGTCFFEIDESLTNADWQSVLYYRGDYKKKDLDNLPQNWQKNIEKIYKLIK